LNKSRRSKPLPLKHP